ncbi:MAG TPA: TlpA disulfide reductase family protein, partial [Saprospiraceae bacterium]|nr:TlpA disulfide reductase family protein [Saprospiraceae bacterium]
MYQNILCISMLMFLLSCGKPRSSAKIYKIEGIVENLDKGAIVLEKLDLTTNERAYVSKSPIIDGKFSFSDTISGWGLHSFVIDDSVRIPFFIEPGTISVTIPDYTSNKAKILAGINNDLLDKHQFSFEKSTGMALIEQYPNTTFSAFTTYYVLMNNNFEGDTIDQLVGKLTGEALESVYIPYIKKVAQAIQNVNIGKPAPDFMVKDSSGNEIKMSDMRGKYVLLDFWTSWCKPCREANPMWVELYNKYKNEYIEFFGVSFDV